jgi:DNA mismatch repair protein MutL
MQIRIERLPQAVVDSIAAGEVLERPANLVKELIENSLDAGATEIEVDLDHGGKNIKVTDNGIGMSAEELPLALERHATSKIRGFDDLWSLSTFGFRGEALASCAAVSRMYITSRTRGDFQAHRIKTEFGNPFPIDDVAGSEGTVVQIEDLFANVPARLKFLKTDSAELMQIKKVLKAMALSKPHVTFRVKVKGELIHFWQASSNHHERSEQILEIKPLHFATGGSSGIDVSISFAPPHKGSRTGQNIWLFAQDRWIQDKVLFASIMDSFRSLLMHGEFPTVVARLQASSRSD